MIYVTKGEEIERNENFQLSAYTNKILTINLSIKKLKNKVHVLYSSYNITIRIKTIMSPNFSLVGLTKKAQSQAQWPNPEVCSFIERTSPRGLKLVDWFCWAMFDTSNPFQIFACKFMIKV